MRERERERERERDGKKQKTKNKKKKKGKKKKKPTCIIEKITRPNTTKRVSCFVSLPLHHFFSTPQRMSVSLPCSSTTEHNPTPISLC